MELGQQQAEWDKCAASVVYFIVTYCQIYDATFGVWVPFELWKSQEPTLLSMVVNRLLCILKARQLGMTWLVLCFALWLMIFHPAATVLFFSRREDEAKYLLSKERLRGVYSRLPQWIKDRAATTGADQAVVWMLSNGSVARAFPTTAGDSYTATMVVVDEADLCPDLNALMRAVKPTIDGGGRMVLLSRSDKSQPASEFKRIYVGGKSGGSGWVSIFLPWQARPQRDAAWYDEQRRDILQRTGSLDDLHEQYPATDAEALSPRTLDKRIAPVWIQQCFVEKQPLPSDDPQWELQPPAIPGLTLYRLPLRKGVRESERKRAQTFVVGADPAEGNPTSDDSAATILDCENGEEVGRLVGKFQPAIFAAHIDVLAKFYNGAGVMIERNNHGHAVLLWLQEYSPSLTKLLGHDGKVGWLSNEKGKTLLYGAAADAFREKEVVIHSFSAMVQLMSIEGATLRAPEGQPDDEADGFALAIVAMVKKQKADAAGAAATPYVHR